jgi:hypothetical protein
MPMLVQVSSRRFKTKHALPLQDCLTAPPIILKTLLVLKTVPNGLILNDKEFRSQEEEGSPGSSTCYATRGVRFDCTRTYMCYVLVGVSHNTLQHISRTSH